jgi:4-diphosphocytidyl-2-C-methyl-D-erythritol kinase
MPTRVRSFCKINLGLAIGPIRPDGFHGLATLYQTLALHDVVTVEAKRLGPPVTSQNPDVGHPARGGSVIELTTNHPGVPTDERNTAWKMVALAVERLGIAVEVKIHIKKDLPVQGGLGAGSANAAAALIGLEKELGLEPGRPGALAEAARLEIAAKVGSDVPLFLIGGAVLGTGRGEIVSPMPDLPATLCVVAVPEVGVSTPRAFQEWDGLCENRSKGKYRGPSPAAQDDGGLQAFGAGKVLTASTPPDRLEALSHVYASVLTAPASDTSGIVRGIRPESKQGGFEGDVPGEESAQNGLAGNPLLALVRTGIENDFEQVVFLQHPSLRDIKRLLLGSPDRETAGGSAIYAALSGSGSALFGLYRTEEDAVAAQQRVQASGCTAIVTSTLPRQEYWRGMFAE